MSGFDLSQMASDFLAQYAYNPGLVYSGVCFFMLLSAFGIPIPEEITLVSAGLVGYMALNPTDYPPPYPGAIAVNVYTLAATAFVSVLGADYLIYYMGQRFGPALFQKPFFYRLVSQKALDRIQTWTQKYGYWAVFLFRFTPGVRFPGHLMCGAMGVSRRHFIAVDTLAAGISVPTQVLLVAFYGEVILDNIKQFKLILFSLLAISAISFLVYKWLIRQSSKKAQIESSTAASRTNPDSVKSSGS